MLWTNPFRVEGAWSLAGSTAATAAATANIDHGKSIVISFNPHDTLVVCLGKQEEAPELSIETTGLVALCRSDAR